MIANNMNTKIDTVNVAIVGYGWWGSTLAPMIKANPCFNIKLVVDNNEEASARAAADGYQTANTLEAALEDQDIQAIFLCTPHSEHAFQLLACAFSNKHTFCEKPLCPTLNEALKAIKLFEQKNLVLGVGHDLRFSPSIIDLIKSVKNNELGRILQINGVFSHNKFLNLPSTHWRLSPLESPVGPFTSGGIHLMDIAIAILGPARSVLARQSNSTELLQNGDSLSIMLNFNSGATALFSNLLTSQFDNRISVYGTKGWFELRQNSHKEHIGKWSLLKNLGDTSLIEEIIGEENGVASNLEAFARAIIDSQPYPIMTYDILYGIAAYEGIMDSLKTNRVESIKGII
jgi:predicted dehydrogenase